MPKIVAERANGRFTVDTWQSGPGSANQIASIGGMRPFEEAAVIPDNRFKAIWRNQVYRFVDSENQFMFAYAASIDRDSLFFNTNLVDADEITSIQDQLDPRWVGKIARNRVPQTDGLARTYVQPGGKEFLEALWSGGYVRIIEDVRTCEDSLARGTVAFAACGAQGNFDLLIEQGLPIAEKQVDGFPSWRVGELRVHRPDGPRPEPERGQALDQLADQPRRMGSAEASVEGRPDAGPQVPGNVIAERRD